jgi:hypothetical protein
MTSAIFQAGFELKMVNLKLAEWVLISINLLISALKTRNTIRKT